MATFQGGPYQNVRYFFGEPLNVKLFAERPPGVVFVGKVFKIPSKCKLTFSRPPQKHLKNVADILGTSLFETLVILYVYLYIYIYISYIQIHMYIKVPVHTTCFFSMSSPKSVPALPVR